MNEDYRKLQIEGSDWSYGSRWGDQMENSIHEIFENADKNQNVLDVGCGEGRGLVALNDLGFNKRNLIGIDIAPEKIKAAINRGFIVLDQDFHYLEAIPDNYFEYVYSSHTLEHAYDLELAFKSLIRVCKNTFYFIVPSNEVKEYVDAHNPSHVSPIKNKEQIDSILSKLNCSFKLTEKKRMCDEIWGVIYK